MAKLQVYMAGLLAIVVPPLPVGGAGGVVLCRKTEGETVGGMPVPLHRARIRFRAKGDPDPPRTVLLGGRDVTFSPDGQKPLTVVGLDRFLPLGLFEGKVGQARQACSAGPSGLCAVGAREILEGRVTFTGGTLFAVKMRGIYDVDLVDDAGGVTVIGATAFDGSVLPPTADQQFANGIVYECATADGAFTLSIAGEAPLVLDPEPGDPGDEPVTVVWMVNTIADDTVVLPDPLQNFDRDFDLLYDFSGDALKRFVPHLSDSQAGDSPGDPPGKCMPAILYP